MKLSVKSDYAARAILALARHYHAGTALRAETLAAEQGVSANYLVQILIELKTGGLVQSLRGKEGGYRLARPPSQVTLGDVLRSIHGQVFDTPALSDPDCPQELRIVWQQLQKAMEETADATSFQEILESEERQKMYYI